MSERAVTPKSLVLDLLRVAAPAAVPVSGLVSVAELFGLSGNALRVAVARLAASGLLESDERGAYRLSPRTSPLTEHVERWRVGERRMRRWGGSWLAAYLPAESERARRHESRHALTLLGMREVRRSFWVRPDNLAELLPAAADKLRALGLDPSAEVFLASELSARFAEQLTQKTWNTKALLAGYAELLRAVSRSAERLNRLPEKRALVESFRLGGSAIRVLATDPLLPPEILPGDARRRLTEAMLKYDAQGRAIWSRALGGVPLESAPRHLSVVEGAA